MRTFIKKNSAFLYWVLFPSLLLMASIFGVNFISRPAGSFYGSWSPFGSCSDSACNSVPRNCIVEFCNSNSSIDFCDIDSFNTGAGGDCANCYVCQNGRCEELIGENSTSCPEDCTKSGNSDTRQETCLDFAGAPITTCGADLDNANGTLADQAPALDGCCPVGCQGADSLGPSFDGDCCDRCGDGVVNTLIGEQCETVTPPAGAPANPTCAAGTFCNGQCLCQSNCGNGVLDSGEECDPVLTAQPNFGCPTQGQTCDNLCQCSARCGDLTVDPGETCDPPNGTTCDANCQLICGNGTIDPGEECDPPSSANCDANCQIIQICGNGVVEVGEECEGTTCNATINGEAIPGVCQACQCIPECQAEGAGCGDDGTGNPGVCFAGTGGTGGSSLIPVGVHTGVLAQWLAAFAVPGAAFVGVKVRRRFKK